jgi:long-chain acyl-CoA synthetase
MPPPRPLQLRHDYFAGGSIEVEPAKPNEGPVRRIAVAPPGLLERPAEGVETTSDIISYSAKKYGRSKAIGWRDVITVHEEQKDVKKIVDGKEVTQKKTWKFFELSDYKYLDYIELEEAISQAARGLASLGVSSDHVFNIFAATGSVSAASCV